MKKEKPNYSMISNIIFSLQMHWERKKSTILFCVIGVIMNVLQPFAGILMPKIVIDELEAGVAPAHFIAVVCTFAVILVLLNYMKSYADVITNSSIGTIASFDSHIKGFNKRIEIDYELMEDPDVKMAEEKAGRATRNNHTLAHNIPRTLVKLVTNIAGLILYGSVITTIHPVISVLLILSTLISWFTRSFYRKYEKATREERALLDGKLEYVEKCVKTPDGAKDIRLYLMSDWIKDLFGQLEAKKQHAESKVDIRGALAQAVDALLVLLRDGAAYAFLIYLLLAGDITLGNFVLVFSAIGSFAEWVSGIISESNDMIHASSEMCDWRAYLDISNASNTGEGIPLPLSASQPPDIKLDQVSYTYPGAKKAALQNIDIHIKSGERIAVVGENGAGKTTLVKLICGLYRPETGIISLEGNDIRKYNRDEYFSNLSTVFQDIHLLTTDINGNISQSPPEKTDYEKVENCLKLSGLYDMVWNLPKRGETQLVREISDDAIQLSGGQLQKLALARALYKNAPVIILDEPTAALDPIAESEIYQKYAQLTKGKTSIYISHRLSSTRFCDRILFVDNHVISECGSHDELMRLGGKYARMFEIQSHYYKQDEEVQLDDQ